MRERTRFDHALAAATLVPLLAVPALHVAGALQPLLLGPLLFLGAPHVLATLGLYADGDIRAIARADGRRAIAVPLLAIPAAVLAFAVAPDRGLLLLVAGFFVWQVQHYTRQNVGVVSLWCAAGGHGPMQPRDRAIIRATTAAGAIGVLRAVELVPEWHRWLQAAGVVVILGCLVAAGATAPGRRRALATASIFYLPLLLSAPGLLGAAFAYQAAHGAQYYLVVGRTLRGHPGAQRVAVLSVLLGGTVAVAVLAPTVLVAAPILYGVGKGLAISHFLADARLWRLRDPVLGPLLRDRLGLDAVRTARSSDAAPSPSPLG